MRQLVFVECNLDDRRGVSDQRPRLRLRALPGRRSCRSLCGDPVLPVDPQQGFGLTAVFVVIAVIVAIAAVAVTQIGPEAKGLALDEIAPPTA